MLNYISLNYIPSGFGTAYIENGGSAVLTNRSSASPSLFGEYTVVSSDLDLISITCRASDSIFLNLLLEVCWDLGAALASA